MMFGKYLRKKRIRLQEEDAEYSLRRLAGRIGVEPSYLSKVERGETAPPSEAKIVALAEELGEDPDVLLAMAGKVSSDLQGIIMARPKLFAEMIRKLKSASAKQVEGVVKKVRDGNW
jgi:transcriptional regulator with XRE-family HTH domain